MSSHRLNPDKWIERYSDYLFHYTLSRVNDREIAKDIIQDTFFAALRAMKSFKGEASERTWLIAILKRKIIDYYRKINSKKAQSEIRLTYNTEDQQGEWLEERIADSHLSNPQDILENLELSDAIFGCIDKLPEKQAAVFRMKSILNYDTPTICNELNITASNFWVLIHRARTAMAACLEKNWFSIET